jgi:hypothetical protein
MAAVDERETLCSNPNGSTLEVLFWFDELGLEERSQLTMLTVTLCLDALDRSKALVWFLYILTKSAES